MSPDRQNRVSRNTSFPRVSGDEPFEFHLSDARAEFSPRERG